jgi:hypothetical protein
MLQRFARDAWNLGVVHQTIEDIARHGICRPIQWFPRNAWRIFADPFCVVHADGQLTVLAEVMNHWVGRGEIWQATVAAGTNPIGAQFKRHIAGSVHLSYPVVATENSVTYAIVESHEAGGLFLWRQDNGQWHYVRTLMTGPVVDATLYHDGQLWWLFCTFGNDGPNERLHLFYSRSLLARWTAHPANPVKTDLGSARPAGTLFQVDGKLIRPSQNSVKTYGGSLMLNHVVTLTQQAFAEIPLRQILPQSDYYNDGIHTIAAAGDYTLIDGKRWHFGVANLPRAVLAKAFKLRRSRRAGRISPEELLERP